MKNWTFDDQFIWVWGSWRLILLGFYVRLYKLLGVDIISQIISWSAIESIFIVCMLCATIKVMVLDFNILYVYVFCSTNRASLCLLFLLAIHSILYNHSFPSSFNIFFFHLYIKMEHLKISTEHKRALRMSD